MCIRGRLLLLSRKGRCGKMYSFGSEISMYIEYRVYKSSPVDGHQDGNLPGTSSNASMSCRGLSNQCLPLEHTLFDFSNDITPVVLAHKNDTPSPSAHATRPTEPMDEVDGGVWHIV